MTDGWLLTLKNVFFPIFCRQCGYALLTEENALFCPACWGLPERIARPFCSVCGQPLKARIGFGEIENFPCAKCHQKQDRPYRRIYAAAIYEGAIAEAVKLLKFGDRPHVAEPIAEVMSEFATREMDTAQYDDLVPVPLHRIRQRHRGFNQADLLAERLQPVFPEAQLSRRLRRIRPTRAQSTINDQKERLQNVVGAFAVDRDRDFIGRTVLLIDDVVTTGGTVSECAGALRRAGAVHVDVLAAAIPIDNPERLPKRPGDVMALEAWAG